MSSDEYKPINEEYAKGSTTGQGSIFKQGGAQGNIEFARDRAERAKAVSEGLQTLQSGWVWVIFNAVPVWSLLLAATLVWLAARLFMLMLFGALPSWLEWMLPVAACGVTAWKREPIMERAYRAVSGDPRWVPFASHVLAALSYIGLSLLVLYVFFTYLW